MVLQMKAQGAVEALLQSGVSPNTRYRSWTALHMACTPVVSTGLGLGAGGQLLVSSRDRECGCVGGTCCVLGCC
jgi:hypothetical protein